MIDKKVDPYIGELSQETILSLAQSCETLIQSEGWKEYRRLLEGAMHSARATGFSDTPENFRYWQGFVSGIAYGPEILDEVIKAAKLLGEKEEAKGAMARRLPLADEGDLTF